MTEQTAETTQASKDAANAALSEARNASITHREPPGVLDQPRPKTSDEKHMDEVLEALDEKHGVTEETESPEAFLEELLQQDEEAPEEADETEDDETSDELEEPEEAQADEEAQEVSRAELLDALSTLKGKGFSAKALEGLTDAQIVGLASGGSKSESADEPEVDEADLVEGCPWVESVSSALEEEVGEEASSQVRQGLTSIARQFGQYDKAFTTLTGVLHELVSEIGVSEALRAAPGLASDPQALKALRDEADALHATGKFSSGLAGIREAYRLAAKSSGMAKPAAKRTPSPPTRGGSSRSHSKMSVEEFERRALVAAERGDTKESQRLRELRKAGRVG